MEFERTNWVGSDVPTHITYTMRKTTPVGLLEAHATVKFSEFLDSGVEATDGKMFNTLGAALNREEMNRVLEAGANLNFGSTASVEA